VTSLEARANGRADDRSLGDLLRSLTGELQQLFRAELQLAKIEVHDELDHVKDTAKHGALAAGAAVMAVLLLSFAAAWGLAEVMPAGLAFLIVGAVYAVVAIIAGLAARDRAKQVDLKPNQTIETLEEDAQWLKTRSK
jgi:uncharacterized membrane protein YqjE